MSSGSSPKPGRTSWRKNRCGTFVDVANSSHDHPTIRVTSVTFHDAWPGVHVLSCFLRRLISINVLTWGMPWTWSLEFFLTRNRVRVISLLAMSYRYVGGPRTDRNYLTIAPGILRALNFSAITHVRLTHLFIALRYMLLTVRFLADENQKRQLHQRVNEKT